MTVLKLRYYGDPVLRKRCPELTKFDEELKRFAKDLEETLYAHPAAGLAAPQVGSSLRIFTKRNYVVREDGTIKYTDAKFYINSKITPIGFELQDELEGCISVPGPWLPIIRPMHVRIEACDLDGKPFVEELDGYKARCVMHENDHVNGVLFFDRADPKDRNKIEPVLRAIKKKYNP